MTASLGKKAVPSDSKNRVTKAHSEIVRERESVDPDGSDVAVESIVDPDVELERLRNRMTEIEAMKNSRSLPKMKQKPTKN